MIEVRQTQSKILAFELRGGFKMWISINSYLRVVSQQLDINKYKMFVFNHTEDVFSDHEITRNWLSTNFSSFCAQQNNNIFVEVLLYYLKFTRNTFYEQEMRPIDRHKNKNKV
jgi:hypothetical protein